MANVGIATLVRRLLQAVGAARREEVHDADALRACPPWRHLLIKHRTVVIRVADDSMMPTVPRGAYILVDRAARAWQACEIVAVRIESGVIVTRAGHDGAGRRVMVSDNPDWPLVRLPGDAEIVGRALCVARGII